ncbi:MAG: hypothetical protein ACRBBP_09105 [Bdellovibrionales bacterium]
MKALKYIPLTICLVSLFGCSQPEFAEDISSQPLPVEGQRFGNMSLVIDQQATEKIVDLLIVVDNSTSMARDQEKLSREFSSFVSSISDADYRIGVITTDTDSAGKEDAEGFHGNLAVVQSTGKRFIEKSDSNPSDLFSELIKREETTNCSHSQNTCASFEERPLYAIKMAIDKRDTVNRGFFREGADLGVIIISDEDETDFSDGTYYSAQNLFDHFQGEFGVSKKMTSFNISILEGDVACYQSQAAETNSGTAVSYGIRTGELASLTGGFSVDICDQNFRIGLNLISNYVEKNLLPLKVAVNEKIIIESIIIVVTTPEGDIFDTTHVVEGGVLKISPLPPEGSRIDLKYSFEL